MTSFVSSSAAAQLASTFAVKTRSGIITPFGSEVEPLVYCKITNRSGSLAGNSKRSPDGLPGPGITAAIGIVGGSPGIV